MMIWAGTVALLTLSAKVQIPMLPVPMTLQTAVVLALPCLFGRKMALSSIGSYLALGFMGVPVFALGAGAGPAYFVGPTAGYLIGFMAAAYIVGIFYKNKGDTINIVSPSHKSSLLSFVFLSALMLVGHGLILGLGTLWLAYGAPSLGSTAAITAGFMPFIAGSVLKSLMAAAFVKAFQK